MAQKEKKKPFVAPMKHPVHRKTYRIPTNQVDEFTVLAKKWIYRGKPGAVVYGRPGIGKTQAINFFSSMLETIFEGEKIPYFIGSCPADTSMTSNKFYEFLLNMIGGTIVPRTTSESKRITVIHYLSAVVDQSGQNKIIFFMDEAQNMDKPQYNCLINVHNELKNAGINLIVFLVGQEELADVKSDFKSRGLSQIIRRFMIADYKFTGVRGINDLSMILKSYDEEAIYPTNTDCTFTEFFFFDHFQKGFRLSNYVEEFYEAFLRIKSAAQINKKADIPMEYVIEAIEYVLTEFGDEGSDLQNIGLAQWEEAINDTLYVDSEIAYWGR
ncbi:ATP-binding protein [Enterococcus casseliflavus]|uniref:ATP-binding protein n=1 Tax=Enterococcus casseliflavus TaxID=37734 RepID=UPI003D105514